MKKKVKILINEEKMKTIRYSSERENEELRKEAIKDKAKGDDYFEMAEEKKRSGKLKLSVECFKFALSKYDNAEFKYAKILASNYQTKEDEAEHRKCQVRYLSCCDKIRRIEKLIKGNIMY